jgi:arsenite methyltransferase
MVAILGFSREKVIAAVKDMYTAVATAPDQPFHFPVGRNACRALGYPEEILREVPEDIVESFAGVGYPFRAGILRPGATVLDVGAGSGTDAVIAARLAGPRGKVYALDMTPAMVRKLRERVARFGIGNLDVIEGSAEEIPLPDASVDVVTSNGVLNLVPDKRRAIDEIFRVLRPGGRVQIADIVIHRPVTRDCADDPKLWAECVVGATVDDDYLRLFRDAGFQAVTLLRELDYFALSPSADTREIARRFGARALEITMQRVGEAPSPLVKLARRWDPRRALLAIRRRGLAGTLALALSVLACYGTLAATAMLPLIGVTLAVNEALWTGTILAFAALATVATAAGIRKHGARAPLVVALLGTTVLFYAHLVSFSMALELAGFVILALGVGLDLRIRGTEIRRGASLAVQSSHEASGKRAD